jgi:hypothetical protein
MEEVQLNAITLKVTQLSSWESFLADVLDLEVMATDQGLLAKFPFMDLYLEEGEGSVFSLDIVLPQNFKEAIYSRWSFFQYRAETDIQCEVSERGFCFQLDKRVFLSVNFSLHHSCELSTPSVRNY